jgi:hypothetical protein
MIVRCVQYEGGLSGFGVVLCDGHALGCFTASLGHWLFFCCYGHYMSNSVIVQVRKLANDSLLNYGLCDSP